MKYDVWGKNVAFKNDSGGWSTSSAGIKSADENCVTAIILSLRDPALFLSTPHLSQGASRLVSRKGGTLRSLLALDLKLSEANCNNLAQRHQPRSSPLREEPLRPHEAQPIGVVDKDPELLDAADGLE